jgi:hypothetical protein
LVLQGLVHRLEIDVRLILRVGRAEDPVGVLGSVRLRAEEIDRREAETLGQLQDRLVIRVDELSAELRLLTVGPERVTELGPVRVHAAAHAT